MSDEARLVLAFDSDHPEFVRGVEVGIIWAHISNAGGYHGLCHANNSEMVLRMAESQELPFFANAVSVGGEDETWLVVHIGEEPENCPAGT